MAWTTQTRNTATLLNILRYGSEKTLGDLANYTFNDVVFLDGKQLKDITFADLAVEVWSTVTRNTATLTTQTRNS